MPFSIRDPESDRLVGKLVWRDRTPAADRVPALAPG